VEERREALEARAREIQARLDEGARPQDRELGMALTLEASLATIEAQRAWCERARTRLQEESAGLAGEEHHGEPAVRAAGGV
jgi:hypothetical protein